MKISSRERRHPPSLTLSPRERVPGGRVRGSGFAKATALHLRGMLLALVATALLGALSPHARGQSSGGSVASKIGFDQKLDAQVPLDIPLKDEAGKPVRLGDFFGERPVILTLVYHDCPMLCNEVLNALTRGLKGLTFDVGDQFEVVTVSINPAETTELAASEEGRLPQALREAGGRARLALPDGRRGLDPQARAVGRVPIRLHARIEAVRPRGGDRPADARGGGWPATSSGSATPRGTSGSA